ncbi:hypothetical protein AVO44_18775 [Ruegeria profundi]|uniref:Nickel/cobalt efflux system n=1 Tax=Ruegeria profundi TaxID=1685378 RepID=A0A0X3TMW7_9RHOB|nr:hypothetical protein AVO44_18775 [Ruegeria profundi]
MLLCTIAFSNSSEAQSPETITWDALVPGVLAEDASGSPDGGPASDEPVRDGQTVLPHSNAFDPLSAGDVVVEEWEESAFRVAQRLLSTSVTIDGYVLPLASEQGRVIEFLLVPWVGACIHTPAPPPNQIIHVSYPNGLSLDQDFDAVRLTGTLVSEPADHRLYLVDGQRDIPVSYALVDAAEAGPPGKVVASSVDDIPLAARTQIWIGTLFTESMTAFGRDGSWSALGFALVISFAYGALHTLGPGHGKAVVVSFFVGSGGSLSRGLSMGTRIAVFHVLSAILVVLLLDFAVRKATGAAPSDYRAIRLGSYALIILIGAVMLWQALAAIRIRKGAAASGAHDHSHDRHGHSGCAACSAASAQKGSGWVAAAVGVVPCTGALLVMLFGLANDLVLPAIAMVVAISAGMAMAMSAIGITALWGRAWAERRLGTNDARRARVESGARLAGASCVLLIGLLLFWTTYTQEQTLAVPEITLAERSEFPSD